MKPIFINPKFGDKVIITAHDGTQRKGRIIEVSRVAIRVSSCNMIKFKRNGEPHGNDICGYTIKPA